MYAYLTRPVSGIVAKIPVLSVERMRVDEAVKLAEQSMHTEQEIRDYCGSMGCLFRELFVYRIGKVQYGERKIKLRNLVDTFDFWPSSTFIPLSHEGCKTLDELGGF